MSAHAASRRSSYAPPQPVAGPPGAHAAFAPAPRRLRWHVLAACALFVASAAAGWALVAVLRTEQPSRPKTARVVPLGATAVTVPVDWAPAQAGDTTLTGLPSDAAAFAPSPGLTAHVVVLRVSGPLPQSLRTMTDGSGGRATTLAGHEARIFPERPLGRDRMGQLTVARTAAGTLAVVCVARTAAWVGAAGCAQHVGAPEPG